MPTNLLLTNHCPPTKWATLPPKEWLWQGKVECKGRAGGKAGEKIPKERKSPEVNVDPIHWQVWLYRWKVVFIGQLFSRHTFVAISVTWWRKPVTHCTVHQREVTARCLSRAVCLAPYLLYLSKLRWKCSLQCAIGFKVCSETEVNPYNLKGKAQKTSKAAPNRHVFTTELYWNIQVYPTNTAG